MRRGGCRHAGAAGPDQRARRARGVQRRRSGKSAAAPPEPSRAARAQAHDVPAQELDWLVCNSGADIWHATAAGDAGGVAWSADERWEHHIDFRRVPRLAPRRRPCAAERHVGGGAGPGSVHEGGASALQYSVWRQRAPARRRRRHRATRLLTLHLPFPRRWERSQLAKAVTKMLAGGEPKALASAPTLLKALALLPDGQERGAHPHHFALPLDAEAKSLLGAPRPAPALPCPGKTP